MASDVVAEVFFKGSSVLVLYKVLNGMAQKSHGSQHGTRHKLSSGPRDKVTVNERLKQFEEGDQVRIDLKGSVQHGRVHNRFHGRTAEVQGMRGDAYRIRLTDKGKSKQLFIKPVHLEDAE